ncbi:MAG TPA: hypothetical protein VJS92_11605 [Candidatus Polarisedimenticolaceae bacterium]|nr:hypothetical protein [Candidatus Polarisedimenticolaceae bacterium]
MTREGELAALRSENERLQERVGQLERSLAFQKAAARIVQVSHSAGEISSPAGLARLKPRTVGR